MSTPSQQFQPSSEAVLERVRADLQAQQLETLVQTLTDKCFAKCVHKPGTSLSSSEQQCIFKTMDRYMDVLAVVFKTLVKKANANA